MKLIGYGFIKYPGELVDQMKSDNSYSPSESEVSVNSYIEDAPPIPQKLSTKSYQNMMKVFLQGNYEREPLDLKLRDVECANCGVLHKRGNLNRYKVCSSGKCIRTIFGVIPACFRRLTKKQLDCLRFVQIYSRKQCSNSSYIYERYKGTANLSVNWRVWKQCGGLVGFNNDYNKMKQVYPEGKNSY